MSRSPHISIEVDTLFHERVRVAAAERDMTVDEYALTASEEYLRQHEETSPSPELTAATDPILAERWDNSHDAAYDRL